MARSWAARPSPWPPGSSSSSCPATWPTRLRCKPEEVTFHDDKMLGPQLRLQPDLGGGDAGAVPPARHALRLRHLPGASGQLGRHYRPGRRLLHLRLLLARPSELSVDRKTGKVRLAQRRRRPRHRQGHQPSAAARARSTAA
ncbi:MAG: hypothetical protein MZV63_46660 [Marinilabiliales bacterium]|nr:hypothetical protein [Marinilabiliales bacterium]